MFVDPLEFAEGSCTIFCFNEKFMFNSFGERELLDIQPIRKTSEHHSADGTKGVRAVFDAEKVLFQCSVEVLGLVAQ